jgi:hypothetical protein
MAMHGDAHCAGVAARLVLDGYCLMAARGREGNERCCGLVR